MQEEAPKKKCESSLNIEMQQTSLQIAPKKKCEFLQEKESKWLWWWSLTNETKFYLYESS